MTATPTMAHTTMVPQPASSEELSEVFLVRSFRVVVKKGAVGRGDDGADVRCGVGGGGGGGNVPHALYGI